MGDTTGIKKILLRRSRDFQQHARVVRDVGAIRSACGEMQYDSRRYGMPCLSRKVQPRARQRVKPKFPTVNS
jgi:hypothetical protein